MSNNVRWSLDLKCIGFFSKFFTKCYKKDDVDEAVLNANTKFTSLELELEHKLSECSDSLNGIIQEKDSCIVKLNNAHKEISAANGRNASNRESTINGLKQEITELKQVIKDTKIEHNKELTILKNENSKKIKMMSKTCADGILKADKAATKKKAAIIRKPIKVGKRKVSPKLSKEQVIAIFTRGNAGEERSVLVKEFNTNKTTVGRIITGENYVKYTKHLIKKESK